MDVVVGSRCHTGMVHTPNLHDLPDVHELAPTDPNHPHFLDVPEIDLIDQPGISTQDFLGPINNGPENKWCVLVYVTSDLASLCVKTQILKNCSVIKTGYYQIIGTRIASSAALGTITDLGEWLIEKLSHGDHTLFALNYGQYKVFDFK